MRRHCSFAVLVLLFSCAASEAQNPLLLPPPDPADLRQILSGLKTELSQYTTSSAAFSCFQKPGLLPGSAQGSSRVQSVVTVDFLQNTQPVQSGVAANLNVSAMISTLLKPNAGFSFRHWGMLRAQRAAVLESNENLIYVEPAGERVWRIVFRGFDTGAHFTNFNCQAAPR